MSLETTRPTLDQNCKAILKAIEEMSDETMAPFLRRREPHNALLGWAMHKLKLWEPSTYLGHFIEAIVLDRKSS